MAPVGWLIILVGLLFLALGAMAAWKDIKSKRLDEANTQSNTLQDLTELIKAIGSLPQPAMLTVLGLFMIVGGGMMVNGSFDRMTANLTDKKPAAVEAPAARPAVPATPK